MQRKVVGHPEQPISAPRILSVSEHHRLPVQWNGSEIEYPMDMCIHHVFEAQADRTPDAVAIRFCPDDAEHGPAEQLTYGELNRRSNQLARHLRKLGVGPEVPVGICLERSLDVVVGILGILKSGGAYLPLDPTYPIERLAFMLDDARAPIMVTQQHLRDKLPETNIRALCMDSEWEVIERETADNLVIGDAANLAYIIYTSGSAGDPKGVLITHSNVVRLFEATDDRFHFNERDVWTLFHSYAFDFSVWELWGALLYGGQVVVVPHMVSRSPEAFYELLHREQVTVLNQTPSAFRQLMHFDGTLAEPKPLSLRYVIFGGEALNPASLRPWVDRHGDERPQLVNMYGITETTVHVTYRRLKRADVLAPNGSVVGAPIPDVQIYLLDPRGQPVPVGGSGEVHVGGAGVGRGYLNRPELTEQRFIANPFEEGPDSRLFKTGDLARYLRNGDLEYLGRLDHQIQVRGFRVELGEIESVLGRHEAVSDAVVAAREDMPGDVRLVAYVVVEKPLSTSELRGHLHKRLPDYMMPNAFVFLDALPLTPNGKVDREALPAPVRTRTELADTYVAPRSPIEETIAAVWTEVLGVKKVGVNDNFFELGGHSLLATQLISRIRETLQVETSLRRFFEAPTVAALAEAIANQQKTNAFDTGPIHRKETTLEEELAELERLAESEVMQDPHNERTRA